MGYGRSRFLDYVLRLHLFFDAYIGTCDGRSDSFELLSAFFLQVHHGFATDVASLSANLIHHDTETPFNRCDSVQMQSYVLPIRPFGQMNDSCCQ